MRDLGLSYDHFTGTVTGNHEKVVQELSTSAEANLAWLKTRKGWRSNVLNFSLGLFKQVKPRAITRDIDWGIPVPVDG